MNRKKVRLPVALVNGHGDDVPGEPVFEAAFRQFVAEIAPPMALEVLGGLEASKQTIVLDDQRIDHGDGSAVIVVHRIDAVDGVPEVAGSGEVLAAFGDDVLVVRAVEDGTRKLGHPHALLGIDAMLVQGTALVGLSFAAVFNPLKQEKSGVGGITLWIRVCVFFRIVANDIRAVWHADELAAGIDIHAARQGAGEERLGVVDDDMLVAAGQIRHSAGGHDAIVVYEKNRIVIFRLKVCWIEHPVLMIVFDSNAMPHQELPDSIALVAGEPNRLAARHPESVPDGGTPCV